VEVLIAIVIVALVALFVTVPLRGAGTPVDEAWDRDRALATLEVRKQAKYREIRDTEMDRAQGKITTSEFELQDAELRAEAIAILKEIEEIEAAEAGKEPAEVVGKREPGHDPEDGGGRTGESV
jgi:hypothetical protein